MNSQNLFLYWGVGVVYMMWASWLYRDHIRSGMESMSSWADEPKPEGISTARYRAALALVRHRWLLLGLLTLGCAVVWPVFLVAEIAAARRE